MKEPRVVNHDIISMPIVFVEEFKDFLSELKEEKLKSVPAIPGVTEEYCRYFYFEGSPLKFIVFSESAMRTIFGKKKYQPIVDATLASFAANRIYPKNKRLALNHAIKELIKYDCREAYDILAKQYVRLYNETCPYVLDELTEAAKTPQQQLAAQNMKPIPGNFGKGISYWSNTGKLPPRKKIENGKISNVNRNDIERIKSTLGQETQPQQPVKKKKAPMKTKSGVSDNLGNIIDGLLKKAKAIKKFRGEKVDNPNFKPDFIIRKANNTSDYNPMESLQLDKKTDNFTRAVASQLKMGRTLIGYTDNDGKFVSCHDHRGQVFYMKKNIEGLTKLLSDSNNFENKGTYLGVLSFTKDFNSILDSLPENPSPEELETASDGVMEAYRKCLELSNKDKFSSSLLKNFGEFVEHNYELMRGEENYMPGVGNFEVGDKVVIGRDGSGKIIRMEHGSFKTEKKKIVGKVKFAGAAPSISGELAAVTFLKNEKQDKEVKKELEALFRDKDSLNDKQYLKSLTATMKKNFGEKSVKEFKKIYAEVMKNDENAFKSKLDEIDFYIKKYPKAKDNLLPYRAKLLKHIYNYCATEPIFNSRKTANFSTQIMAFDLNSNNLFRGERSDVESYKRHSKFSAVKLRQTNPSLKDLMDIKKVRKMFDIQGANAKPIYNVSGRNYG